MKTALQAQMVGSPLPRPHRFSRGMFASVIKAYAGATASEFGTPSAVTSVLGRTV